MDFAGGQQGAKAFVAPDEVNCFTNLNATRKADNGLQAARVRYERTSVAFPEHELCKAALRYSRDNIRKVDRKPSSSSFGTKRISPTTFMIQERDAYGEHPLIYAKLHPKANVLILTDTGCDEPDEAHKNDKYIHLREYLEHYPLLANSDEPLNPHGRRKYIIMCTHCHYDHTLGIPQFLSAEGTEIVASAAGRDFIESDLTKHGLFEQAGRPTPKYKVTKWAQAFERLTHPVHCTVTERTLHTDLGITVFHTPGHTPDELAWYDHDEMHLYVGDSLYREGEDGMPIIFPGEGSLIEWVFSMQKLAVFVRGENARAASVASEAASQQGDDDEEDGWVKIPQPLKAQRVLVSCAHQTYAVDGAGILAELEAFSFKCFIGKVPVVKSRMWLGEVYDTWREEGEDRTPMSIQAPRRLMEDARKFFGHS